jgi:glycosyltransferase involved in cell wall biosynthesis
MKNNITLGIIIDTDLRIPPVTGVTYRLYFLSKKLSELGIAVKIFMCNRNIKHPGDERNLFEKSKLEYHIIPENVFYSPKRMELIIKNHNIDIIQFEDAVSVLRYRNIFTHLKLPVCLEMHDVESSLKEMLNYCDDDIKQSHAITSKACKLSDRIICMTPLDREELIYKMGVDKKGIFIAPNPINSHQFRYFGPNTKTKNILFIGNMFYWPNYNAALSIIEKISPEVLKFHSDASFSFVGMTPDKLKKKGNNRLNFHGEADDLNSFLKHSTIALCPVLEGSGMKVKILNYCAAGLPVIATHIGVSGYEKVKSIIVEDRISQYPKLINSLLDDKRRLVAIGLMNRGSIKKYYELTSVAKKMVEIYRDLLEEKRIEKKFTIADSEVPLPLWLDEKRVSKIHDKNYYIIRNGKTISKKKIS